jgi:riboflavin biosynthesis pyrimidine reductase
MTAAFTPELAVQYLAELEPGLEAVAVVSADGTVLAGDPSLVASAEGLMTARSARHVVVARVGAGALEALVRHDLEMVARELG